MINQKTQVLNHLQNNEGISPLYALSRYGIMRLASRIGELRQDGLDIETEHVRHNGKKFAYYRLNEKEEQQASQVTARRALSLE